MFEVLICVAGGLLVLWGLHRLLRGSSALETERAARRRARQDLIAERLRELAEVAYRQERDRLVREDAERRRHVN